MFPTDFDIFSSAIRIIPLCIQMRASGTLAGALGLGDLVLVMGEDEVDAAAVDLEVGAQLLLGHRRALDVPAGAPLAPGALPRGVLAWLRAFQSAKSSGFSLRLCVPASSPWSISSGSRFESLP